MPDYPHLITNAVPLWQNGLNSLKGLNSLFPWGMKSRSPWSPHSFFLHHMNYSFFWNRPRHLLSWWNPWPISKVLLNQPQRPTPQHPSKQWPQPWMVQVSVAISQVLTILVLKATSADLCFIMSNKFKVVQFLATLSIFMHFIQQTRTVESAGGIVGRDFQCPL